MPLHRFEQLRSALHFADESQTSREEPNFDRAYKVRPLIDHSNEAFQAALLPTKQQSVDEHMIKFKGHNIMKQYIKNKPIRWGFKTLCRRDSETGYLFQCEMYTGMKSEGTAMGLGELVMLKLTDELKGFGCEVFFDNFFNSPALLSEHAIKACGTVRANRKGMPRNFPSDKEMKRDGIASFSADGIACVKWMDDREVILLSNFISPVEYVLAQRRCAGKKEKNYTIFPQKNPDEMQSICSGARTRV